MQQLIVIGLFGTCSQGDCKQKRHQARGGKRERATQEIKMARKRERERERESERERVRERE
jgi:hypothetical protein